MDPATIQQILQGGAMAPGTSSPPTPQQILTIQNLMKTPGGMGAMQQQPSSLMQPPSAAQPGAAQPGMGQQSQMNQLMQQMNPMPQPGLSGQ